MESEIEITKKDLKKLSLKFRTIASILLKTRCEEGMSNLKRFMNFIETNLIIYDFIQKQQSTIFDIGSIFGGYQHNRGYPLPTESEEDEIAFTYQLLKYALKNYDNNYHGYVWLAKFYPSKTLQRRVDLFNQNVVQPFVNYIENHLTQLQIDMGEDEQAKIHIEILNNSGDIMPSADNQSKGDRYLQSGNFGIGHMSNGTIEGGAKVAGVINEAEQQNLVEAAAQIQQLLEQLEKSYPTNTTTGRMAIATEAIKQIEANPTLMTRVLSAISAGGVSAVESFLNHPAASFVVGALQDWQTTKGS
jgi:hypothetical protein